VRAGREERGSRCHEEQKVPVFFLSPSWAVAFHGRQQPDRLIRKQPPTAASRPDFYQDFYRSGEKGLGKVRRIQARKLLSASREYLSNAARALDIGCGTGEWVRLCREWFPAVEIRGLDPAVEEKKGLWIRDDLFSFIRNNPGLHHTFDFIILVDVFEHFSDAQKAAAGVRLLLREKGIVLVKVPNKDARIYRLARGIRVLFPRLARVVLARFYQIHFPPPHYYYYNRPSLEKTWARCGFTPLKARYVSETPLTALWQRVWGVGAMAKPLIILGLLGIRLFAVGRGSDSIAMWLQSDPGGSNG